MMLNGLHDELEEIYLKFFPSGPTGQFYLYHYTNYKGLAGILESRQLWLTDYRYLNDNSEINYSFTKISRVLSENLNILQLDQHLLGLFDITLKRNFYQQYEYFVFSCCKRRNYLPAWRWYADNGAGFSIAFDFKTKELLPSIFNIIPAFGPVVLGQVQYNTYMVDQYVISLFNKANKFINQQNRQHQQSIIGAVLCYVLMILPRFKHYSFSEEHEYRIFALKEPKKVIPDEMRIWSGTNYYNTPFIHTIPRIKIDINKININKIIVGPKCNFEHARYEINKLLKQYEYQDIPIVKSRIPYR